MVTDVFEAVHCTVVVTGVLTAAMAAAGIGSLLELKFGLYLVCVRIPFLHN